jgi:hypothetical protein
MSAFSFTEQMNEVTGLGGEIERACKAAVCAGAAWWRAHRGGNPIVDADMGKRGRLYGVNEEGQSLLALIQATSFTLDDGAKVTLGDYLTPQMYYLPLHHVMWIGKHGWKWYVEKMSVPLLIVNDDDAGADSRVSQ